MKKFFTVAWFLTMALLLSGCFKGRIDLQVNSDGSGVYAVSMGLTQEALNLIRAGEDKTEPMQELRRKAEESNLKPEVRQWTDGEYTWTEAKLPFDSPDELNQFVTKADTFEQFSLRQEKGLLKNRYVLDARFSAPAAEIDTETPLFNPMNFIEMTMSAKLPGEVVETNGVTDINTGALSWPLDFNSGTRIYAVSEAWNWFNVGLMGACVVGLGVLALASVGVGGYMYVTKPKRVTPTTDDDLASLDDDDIFSLSDPTKPLDDLLQEIKTRTYLEQINYRVVKNKGHIMEKPLSFELHWPSGRDKIVVKAIDAETISINGTTYPASEAALKQGLIACLQAMNKIM
ncbi:MAG: hypothetical protein H6633_35705 [Anaerolineales bacterium]|nr:hypothetical protein [Anaerolineales bacterium]MCB9109543.1 hypothetical protein [Anaerolineales bacterium]